MGTGPTPLGGFLTHLEEDAERIIGIQPLLDAALASAQQNRDYIARFVNSRLDTIMKLLKEFLDTRVEERPPWKMRIFGLNVIIPFFSAREWEITTWWENNTFYLQTWRLQLTLSTGNGKNIIFTIEPEDAIGGREAETLMQGFTHWMRDAWTTKKGVYTAAPYATIFEPTTDNQEAVGA